MIEEFRIYIRTDGKYIISAIPITMSKFAPSGSLRDKNTNSIFESTRAVIAKSNNEVFLDVKSITLLYPTSWPYGTMLELIY